MTPTLFAPTGTDEPETPAAAAPVTAGAKPTRIKGRAWVIRQDNIDTDMIYHNRYLAVTKLAEMGQYVCEPQGLGGLRKEGETRRHHRHRQELRGRQLASAGG